MKKEEKEIQFIEKIRCNFPYQNIEGCNKLIDEAKMISPNSVFTVIEELARITSSERTKITELELKNLLHKTTIDFKHPLLNSVIKTAHLLIESKEQSVNEALIMMEEISSHPQEWAALSLIYFSCDDIDGIVDEKFHSIREEWNLISTTG